MAGGVTPEGALPVDRESWLSFDLSKHCVGCRDALNNGDYNIVNLAGHANHEGYVALILLLRFSDPDSGDSVAMLRSVKHVFPSSEPQVPSVLCNVASRQCLLVARVRIAPYLAIELAAPCLSQGIELRIFWKLNQNFKL